MKVTIYIPESSLSITKETPEGFGRSLQIAAAMKWYELERISQSKAAELIGCSRLELMTYFRDYNVAPIQVEPDELEAELSDPRI